MSTADLPIVVACFDCEDQGFIVTDGGADIERCDACQVYPSDRAALAAAAESAVELLKNPKPRAGIRFEKLLAALVVVAAAIRNGHTEPTEE